MNDDESSLHAFHPPRSCIAFGLLCAVSLGAVPALAQTATEEAPRRQPSGPRIEVWEYVAFPAILAGSLALKFGVDRGAANWLGAATFERDVVDALAVDSASARDAWTFAGDVVYIGGVTYAALAPFTTAAAGRPWSFAGQYGYLHLLTLATSAAIVFGLQMLVRRVRPNATGCKDDDPTTECSAGDRESFPGGHTTLTATVAGLSCVHDPRVDLYGSDVAEYGVCGLAIAGLLLTSVSRLTTENHYPVDLLAGLGIGLLVGIGLPFLLHPELGRVETETSERSTLQAPPVVVVPALGNRSVGILALGFL